MKNQNDMYHCTTNISFPKEKVIEVINEIRSRNKNIQVNELYDLLRIEFNVSSFNRKNLNKLLDEICKSKTLNQSTDSENIDLIYSELLELDKLGYLIENTGISFTIPYNDLMIIDEIKKIKNIEEVIKIYFSTKLNNSNEQGFMESYKLLKRKKELQSTLQSINPNNLDIKLERLIIKDISTSLENLNIINIGDLLKKFDDPAYSLIKNDAKFENKLAFLRDDIREELKEILYFITSYNNPKKLNHYFVLQHRSNGLTLESIGNKINVTRERIRQIEKKALENAISLLNHKLLFEIKTILKYLSRHQNVIYVEELNSLVGEELTKLLIYILENFENEHLTYNENYDFILIGDFDWLNQIELLVQEMPDKFSSVELNSYSTRIGGMDIFKYLLITYELVEDIIRKNYSVKGEVFTKSNLNLEGQYKYVLKEYFQNGILIHDAAEIDLFKKYHYRVFKDKEIFNKSKRSIAGVIERCSLLIDKGKYNLQESIGMIDDILLNEIKMWIDSSSGVLLYSQVFNAFRDQLKPFGVINSYMLHSQLRLKFENEYIFRRDYMSFLGSDLRLFDEINSTLETYEKFIDIDEVNKLFPSSSNVVVLNFLNNNEDYISAYNKKWISSKNLIYTENDIKVIEEIIISNLDDEGLITVDSAYELIRIKLLDLFKNNSIDNKHYLFNFLKFILQDKFDFKKPYIALKGAYIGDPEERLISEIIKYNEITINEIKDIADNVGYLINNTSEFISMISFRFLRIDVERFINRKTINIDEDQITFIEDLITRTKGSKLGINAKGINSTFFPKLGFKWNQYSISGFIECYSNALKVIRTEGTYFTCEYIITDKNISASTFEEYMKLSKEN